MNKLKTLDWIALILAIIGGLNWGLVGLFDLDLVALIFGAMSVLARIVYIIVGLAAIYLAIVSPKLVRK
ncbi:MAG: DUF378 domain-containing protein [Patescibacteria group bacterium]